MSEWSGDDLRRLLDRKQLDRDELAELINTSLDTSYNGETVARWLRGRTPAAKVRAFLDSLAVDPLTDDPPAFEPGDEPLEHEPAVDTPPGPGPKPAFPPTPAVGGKDAYTRACTELVEMIAMGVGLVGATLGSAALIGDGAIIQDDAAALGAAYGKLAEQNETFRRMLIGMTTGGVWLQVAAVTGTTLSKCWQNHGYHAHVRADALRSSEHGHTDETDAAAA